MARLQQTQRKRVGSIPRLPDDVVAAIAAEASSVGLLKFLAIRSRVEPRVSLGCSSYSPGWVSGPWGFGVFVVHLLDEGFLVFWLEGLRRVMGYGVPILGLFNKAIPIWSGGHRNHAGN
ncbi:hypothetical protein AgCh_025064 [Apium graveolens]